MLREIKGPYEIIVVLEEKKLYLYKDGLLYKTYLVATGKPSTPTPKGIFKIKNKDIKPGARFGTRWLGLSAPFGSYGIHGTNDPSSIGNEVSDGCIRMYNQDITEIFDLVPIDTKVKII